MNIIGYSKIVARKVHRCGYCAGRIEPGMVYVRWAIADGGSVSDARGHLACEALACAATEPGEMHDVGWDIIDYAISEKPEGVPLAAWLALEIPDVPGDERARFVTEMMLLGVTP